MPLRLLVHWLVGWLVWLDHVGSLEKLVGLDWAGWESACVVCKWVSEPMSLSKHSLTEPGRTRYCRGLMGPVSAQSVRPVRICVRQKVGGKKPTCRVFRSPEKSHRTPLDWLLEIGKVSSPLEPPFRGRFNVDSGSNPVHECTLYMLRRYRLQEHYQQCEK